MSTQEQQQFDAERARALLSYDAATGAIRWRVRHHPRSRRRAGELATVAHGRYLRLIFKGRRYAAHRVAWLLATGAWPAGEIDHIDGNGHNNRLANLRDVSRRINVENRRAAIRGKATPLIGAFRTRGDRWRSSIGVRGVRIPLGTFDTAEQAHRAYLLAKRAIHEGNTL